jgi:hypothetical protein
MNDSTTPKPRKGVPLPTPLVKEMARAIAIACRQDPDQNVLAPTPVEPLTDGEPALMLMTTYHVWELHLEMARALAESIDLLVRGGVLMPGPRHGELLGRAIGPSSSSTPTRAPKPRGRGPRGLGRTQ